uniref:Estradiol 17-beta-dehydrogenase 12 n=1 Tax=Heterorhabditis bacteriophora TaxID=37862 RepID=A0A1I7XMC8_HETBA
METAGIDTSTTTPYASPTATRPRQHVMYSAIVCTRHRETVLMRVNFFTCQVKDFAMFEKSSMILHALSWILICVLHEFELPPSVPYALTRHWELSKICVIIYGCISKKCSSRSEGTTHGTVDWMHRLITGGTDGIGRAYIEELAKTRAIRKFYIIGRNVNKLEHVVHELKERYNAECKTALFDFESDDYQKLPEDLSTIDVGILINCAGIAPNQVGNFMELPEGLASKIMRVNLMSTMKMLELVLPGMIKRNKGCVVNVSSMTGWRPMPYISSYPASKAAISFFSDCLSDEFRHTNVRIQCLIPLLVATKVASYESSEANNIFVVTTENYAKQAVRAIGRFEMITGCVQHDIQRENN